MVAIVDYNAGNIGSLVKILQKLGAEVTIASTPDAVLAADRLILPGVGHFGAAIAELRRRDLAAALSLRVREEGVPLLGVCLGMQLLARRSEEADAEGLGWIAADCVRFRFPPDPEAPKVPNMGWRTVAPRPDSRLFPPLDRPWRFYFVHSYYVLPDNPDVLLATADHGGPFAAAVQDGNIVGVQFHPEKSHRFGLAFLEQFLRFEPQ